MKQKLPPLPPEYTELVKTLETLEQEIHVARKQGCDVVHTWYLFQFARSKIVFVKATNLPDDIAKTKNAIQEVRVELVKAQQQLVDLKNKAIQAQSQEVISLAKQGLELLQQGKKYHATFLYQQMNERYMKLPQEVKQAVLTDCVTFKERLMEMTKELGWN